MLLFFYTCWKTTLTYISVLWTLHSVNMTLSLLFNLITYVSSDVFYRYIISNKNQHITFISPSICLIVNAEILITEYTEWMGFEEHANQVICIKFMDFMSSLQKKHFLTFKLKNSHDFSLTFYKKVDVIILNIQRFLFLSYLYQEEARVHRHNSIIDIVLRGAISIKHDKE